MNQLIKILYIGNEDYKFLLDEIQWKCQTCELIMATSTQTAIKCIETKNPQIVLIDYDQPDFDPTFFVKQQKLTSNGHLVIGLTHFNNLETIVQSIKAGVTDVFHVNGNLPETKLKLLKYIDDKISEANKRHYRKQTISKYDFSKIICQSHQMQKIFQMLTKIVNRKWLTVLILGETGTGKELIANAIHFNSCSQTQPFIALNCTTLPDNLLESEIFGHEKGAFTDAKTQKKGLFEIAQNGTLFLDEIGDINLATQVKLLRAIESKSIRHLGSNKDILVDTRIIAATNKNLYQASQEGSFRIDLYYRLNVISIHLPPLRERQEDIILLANHFLNHFSQEYESSIETLTKDAEQLLINYHWPGNIRELKHTIERVVLLNEGKKITRKMLEEAIEWEIELIENEIKNKKEHSLNLLDQELSLDECEAKIVSKTLEKNGWNKKQTSRILQISRPRLDRLITKHNIKPSWQ